MKRWLPALDWFVTVLGAFLISLIVLAACATTPADHTRNLKLETDGLRGLCLVYEHEPKLPRDEVVTARCKALLEAP